MKFHTILLVCLIGLYSCNDQKKQEEFISNNDIKYWDVISSKNDNKKCNQGYCFYINGTFCRYYYYKSKRYKEDTDDIVYDRTWESLNGSFFMLSNKKVRILTLTKDTFCFQLNDKTIVKLKASQNQKDTLLYEFPYEDFIIWDTIHTSQ